MEKDIHSSMRPKLEITADGSHTLFVPELEEHYHSVNGAVQESKHVFIEMGLHHCDKDEIHIFEIGFGTGLNAYLTLLDVVGTKRTIKYSSVEAYPVPSELVEQLNYAAEETNSNLECFKQLHDVEWGKWTKITDNFCLHKIHTDFTRFNFSTLEGVDLIYFDAFAPDKQNEMWSQDLFDSLYKVANDRAVLTTYCAKGVVRRMMQQAGFLVERLPGPPGKREMLRATKSASLEIK